MADGTRTSDLPLQAVIDDLIVNTNTGLGKETSRVAFSVAASLLAAAVNITGRAVYFDTRANLYADLTYNDKDQAFVYADPAEEYNGVYQKSGAAGAGSWLRLTDLIVGPQPQFAITSEFTPDPTFASVTLTGTRLHPILNFVIPRGTVFWSTNGTPSDTVGEDGDWAIDPATYAIWGPKANSVWPSPSIGAAAAAAATAADRTAVAADRAYVAAAVGGITNYNAKYKTIADLLASTEATRGSGAIWEAQGYRYQEVTTGQHLTTAGGIKLKALGNSEGMINVEQVNVDKTGVTSATTILNTLLSQFPVVFFPAGFYNANLSTSSKVTIKGAGVDQTTILSTTGVTLDVNSDIELADLTLQCNSGVVSPPAATINHDRAYFVRANRVKFYGINHYLSHGYGAAGEYRDCVTYTTTNDGLGACCHWGKAIFWNCQFLGYRAVEVRDAVFHDCVFGQLDITTVCVHMPDGNQSQVDGSTITGFTGKGEFYNCQVFSQGNGITCGNRADPQIYNCYIHVVTAQGLYARSNSTIHAWDTRVISEQNVALAFAKTNNIYSIGISGESALENCILEGTFNSLSIPPQTEAYPTSIGNVILTDCTIVGGDNKISPNNSTYHIIKSKKTMPVEVLSFSGDNQTLRFRFKANEMRIAVYGASAAVTGCSISSLDALTGVAHPEGMIIEVYYAGTSSRFVTFTNATNADGNVMRFDAASSLTTSTYGVYRFRNYLGSWRKIV